MKQSDKNMGSSRIEYSEKYADDAYEYRYAISFIHSFIVGVDGTEYFTSLIEKFSFVDIPTICFVLSLSYI